MLTKKGLVKPFRAGRHNHCINIKVRWTSVTAKRETKHAARGSLTKRLTSEVPSSGRYFLSRALVSK
jgi:hypothetical protein